MAQVENRIVLFVISTTLVKLQYSILVDGVILREPGTHGGQE
jgi:hypothetical protein